ncbi:chemotaxis protein CheW [Clostridium sediminicola]|uniref:chemotaxis protein CheW n=1 Tax=Clostridium sediminicola TaxID=3114879 RepID=UPI0031F27230
MAENLVKNQTQDSQKGKFLTFSIEKEAYGVEISHVTEIINVHPITKVPELPEYIKGIINLRGKIIPVMDVRLKFKKPAVEYDDRTCIVVIDFNDISIGLIVDSVSEVLSISEENIILPPNVNNNTKNYIKNIGKTENKVVLILDCEELLEQDDEETD